MGWFRPSGAPAPVVSVLRRGEAKAAGAAALISRHRVLTCAHVVNDALGRDDLLTPDHPPAVDIALVFRHGHEAPQQRIARVSLWISPPGRTAAWSGGDLAVLELTEAAPEWLTPVSWGEMAEGQPLRAWHGSGQRITYADTEVKLCDGRIAYLDAPLTGAAIGPGYSGGPLWSREQPVAVGLVAAHVMPDGTPFDGQRTVRRSRALPWQAVRDELVRAGASDVLEECSVLPAASAPARAEEDLLPLLWPLLADPATRADHARTLARHLGYTVPDDDSAPPVAELAALLSTHSRALATLSESLAPGLADDKARTALTRLLLHGRFSGTASLLSVGEHHRLLAELREIVEADPTLIPRAAREALRFTPLPEVLHSARLPVDDIALAVGELEAVSDSAPVPSGTPQVPALLYLVECVSAAAGGPAEAELRGWNERVTERLGIHPSALAQRRFDALRWAAHRPSPVCNIQVRLYRNTSDPEGEFRCKLWLLRNDGPPTPLPSSESTPRTAEEVARLVRDAIDGIRTEPGQEHHAPRVTAVVDRGGLHLPVDEWNPGPHNTFVPGLPIGAAFQLTLSCPEMSDLVRTRDAEQHRRWASGHGTPLIVNPDCSPERLTLLLQHSHRDTVQVVLHGPPGDRARFLELCLALGVPVVLWDRTAEDHQHASRLDPVQPTGPLHGLPERVRGFRGDAFGDSPRHPARPSLVWEDTDPSPTGGLQLLDPSEGNTPA